VYVLRVDDDKAQGVNNKTQMLNQEEQTIKLMTLSSQMVLPFDISPNPYPDYDF